VTRDVDVDDAEGIRFTRCEQSLEILMKHTVTTVKAPTRISIPSKTGVRQSLRNSELRYRRLFETAQDGILILNARTGSISDVNPFLIDMLGYSREEFVEKKLWEVGAFRDIEASRNSFHALQKKEFIRYENLPLKTKSGRLVQVEFVSNVYLVGDEKVIQCNIRDISDRKRAETALVLKEEDHWLLIKNLPAGVVVHATDTRIVRCNSEASQLLGISSDLMQGKGATDPMWHFVRDDGTRMPVAEFPVNQVIATGHVVKNFVMGIPGARDGGYTWALVNAYPEFDSSGLLRQVVVMFTDISEIKCAEERVQRHLEHLTALVEIDRAINFSFDLNLSLTTLLTHVIVQLEVDAADVLLFNPMSRSLEYVAGRGFHTKAIEHAHQPFGEGYAGRAAQERTIVHIRSGKRT
jgi:PAS domain S-box-containing protein